MRFGAGETSKTIVVAIINDGYVEGNEALTLSLSNATGTRLGSPATTTITIVDNDTTSSNPFDSNPFIVRQQYLDFLLREPDRGRSLPRADSCTHWGAITGFEKLCEKPPAYSTAKDYQADRAHLIQ